MDDELALIAEMGQCMRDASICGLGQTASSAIESAIGRLAVFTGTGGDVSGNGNLLTPRRMVELEIDGRAVRVFEGSTILDACKELGIDTPMLCYGETLRPANVCRVCVVEVEGARVLAPACSRKVEPAMVVKTDSERVRHSRRLVLEFLGSSVDLSRDTGGPDYLERYAADPRGTGRRRRPTRTATASAPGTTWSRTARRRRRSTRRSKVDNELYVRDYSKCILCYKCVDACGEQYQNTFAIAVAGRGFDARISTEYVVELPESACVYCGNCIAVCPTGALIFKSEYDMREAGTWDEDRQTQTDTICPYCGVGCNLTLHVQDNEIVKVTSPDDHDITRGNLCIKGRFGFQHVQAREPDRVAESRSRCRARSSARRAGELPARHASPSSRRARCARAATGSSPRSRSRSASPAPARRPSASP